MIAPDASRSRCAHRIAGGGVNKLRAHPPCQYARDLR
jgi:hypothetical protein